MVQTLDAQTLTPGERAIHAIYPVHAGSVGGWLYEGVTVLSGLALAILGGVGTWSFLIKPRRKAKRARAVIVES